MVGEGWFQMGVGGMGGSNNGNWAGRINSGNIINPC